MYIYVILIVYLFFVTMIFKKNKKLSLFLMIIPFVTLTSLRSWDLGLKDTRGTYLTIFNFIENMSIFDLIYFRGFDELFFYIFYKFITIINYNYQFVLFMLCLPFFIIVSRHIYMYSKNLILSVVCFMSLYFLFSFYLLKQCLAIAVLIYSYKFIMNKNFKKFLFCVLFATMFHKMSLIFILAYPFANKVKFSYKNYLLVLFAFIVAIYFPNIIYILISKFDYTNTLIKYIGYGVYSVSGSIPILGFLINFVILVYCHLFCYEKEDLCSNIDLNLLTLGCVFYSFSSVIVEFYRVAIFFNIFGITRISNLNNKISKNNKFLLNSVCILVFILYFLFVSSHNNNANPYYFYFGG